MWIIHEKKFCSPAPPSGQNKNFDFSQYEYSIRFVMVVLPNLTSFRLVRSFYQLKLVKMTVGQNWIFSKMTIFLRSVFLKRFNFCHKFLRTGTRYWQMVFCNVFLVVSSISEKYWFFSKMTDHLMISWLRPVSPRPSWRHSYINKWI